MTNEGRTRKWQRNGDRNVQKEFVFFRVGVHASARSQVANGESKQRGGLNPQDGAQRPLEVDRTPMVPGSVN